MAQLTVIHIHHTPPDYLAGVDVQRVALMNVVVDQSGHQVVRNADCMEITGEVQVDVLHGDDLSVTAAGSASFYTKHRSQRRLTQADNGPFTQTVQRICQAHRSGGLTLARRGWADGGHQHQFRLPGQVLQRPDIHLRLIVAIQLQELLIDSRSCGNFCDFFRGMLLRNLNVGLDVHKFPS